MVSFSNPAIGRGAITTRMTNSALLAQAEHPSHYSKRTLKYSMARRLWDEAGYTGKAYRKQLVVDYLGEARPELVGNEDKTTNSKKKTKRKRGATK